MKNLLIIISLLMSVHFVNAQEGGPRRNFNPEERAKANVERLDKELKLTQVQKDSIYSWSLQQSNKQRLLFQESNSDREQMRSKMVELQTEHDAKVKTILDPEQQEKYTKLQEEWKNRRPGGPRRPRSEEN